MALTRITINETGQVIEKNSPFPSGIAGIDYERLQNNGLIATIDNYMQYGNECKSCNPW